MKLKIIPVLLVPFLYFACNNPESSGGTTETSGINPVTPTINYTTVNMLPHDTNAYTEGFLFHDGQLYESTGHTDEIAQTKSLFGTVDDKTGKINTKVEIDKNKYFGEGIVFIKDKVYQLTYQTKIGFVYDAKTFKQLGTFTFPSAEGWGATTDSANIIMSDGTPAVTWLDPVTFKTVKIIQVKDENGPVKNVNELEYIKGFIYANIYGTNYIIKIDPSNGKVLGKIDLSKIADSQKNKYGNIQEMNGIAYDASNDKIYVTGKMWPNIYEIRFDH